LRTGSRVHTHRLLGAVALSLSLAASTSAGADVAVVLSAARVVVGEHGAEQLVTTEAVHPGDVVEYRATYSNQGEDAVHGLTATLPIPDGTVYLPTTAVERVDASTDGVHFAPVPLVRQVVGPDGRLRMEEVPLSEYRALRWQIGELPAKANRSVAARVLVPSVRVAARSTPAVASQATNPLPVDAEQVALRTSD
jgi:uncharacterized repeat protein (TIGR01451 family)